MSNSWLKYLYCSSVKKGANVSSWYGLDVPRSPALIPWAIRFVICFGSEGGSSTAFVCPTPPQHIQVGLTVWAFALLISVMQLLTGNLELDLRQVASPGYEGAVSYVLAVIEDGSITLEFPNVLPDRYSDLSSAADSQLCMYRAAAARSAQALTSPGGASILVRQRSCPRQAVGLQRHRLRPSQRLWQ